MEKTNFELKKIISSATKKYQKYFRKNSIKIRVSEDVINIDFVARKKFSRSYNLFLFEEIIGNWSDNIIKCLKKKKVNDIYFHVASSTDMQLGRGE